VTGLDRYGASGKIWHAISGSIVQCTLQCLESMKIFVVSEAVSQVTYMQHSSCCCCRGMVCCLSSLIQVL